MISKNFKLPLIMFFLFTLLTTSILKAGTGEGLIFFSDTDTDDGTFQALIYFYDLRERETFLQLTAPPNDEAGSSMTAHIQIYNVANNCSENNFNDVYTANDTHIYNMRDIRTNDGNPSGVVLPDNAYGLVVVSLYLPDLSRVDRSFGNMRIIDNNGYEYRTNAQQLSNFAFTSPGPPSNPELIYSFSFNSSSGITFSDIVGINILQLLGSPNEIRDWEAENIVNIYTPFDIDIYDTNEVPFSCRDIIFACTDQDNPRLQELLETAGTANVASFEYGINNAIPHSRGGELLCPGNNISDGIVNLTLELYPEEVLISNDMVSNLFVPYFYGYVGLNNGNDRGSFDSFWYTNRFARLN